VQYQAEALAQVLRLAQAKALELVQVSPALLEVEAVLLQQQVGQVLRQAVALQQLAALPQVPVVLGQDQAVLALVQAEALVEVLEPEQELVQVQLPEEESAH
jgi:hypothetical protein